jgi:hypothetical protein
MKEPGSLDSKVVKSKGLLLYYNITWALNISQTEEFVTKTLK